jgi:hypothetical protein
MKLKSNEWTLTYYSFLTADLKYGQYVRCIKDFKCWNCGKEIIQEITDYDQVENCWRQQDDRRCPDCTKAIKNKQKNKFKF